MKLYPKKAQNFGPQYYEVSLKMLIEAHDEDDAIQNFADKLIEASSGMEILLESGRGKSLAFSDIEVTVKPMKQW